MKGNKRDANSRGASASFEEKAEAAAESARGNIVKETLQQVNETFQSPHIFITLNIILLLIVFFMGRILIAFIEPPPPRNAVDIDRLIETANIETSMYDPYYFRSINSGALMMGNYIRKPGSNQARINKTLIFSSRLDPDEFRSIASLEFKTPIEDFDFRRIPDLGRSKEFIVSHQKSCDSIRCYINIEASSARENIPPGVYSLSLLDKNGEAIKRLSTNINYNYVQRASEPPYLSFDVYQETSGELIVEVDSPPSSDLMKIELSTFTSGNKIEKESRIIPAISGSYTIALPTSIRAFKVGVSPVVKPMYDAINRKFIVHGSFPGYNP